MSDECTACGVQISTLDIERDIGLRKVINELELGFYDGVAKYCSKDCAPASLTDVEYEKDPLQKLVEFFHAENTEDSLEYWTEDRGWKQETVDELLLGWAPPDKHKAYNHLKENGYSNADILSTGAFYSGEPPYTCIWTGRYVFPYYGSDGTAEYMISRRVPTDMEEYKDVDSDMYGHPEDPQGNRKYSKLTKNEPHAIHDEPIYGIESLEENCDVIIAEGIADAISAIEKGYHVLSPVTNSFKNKHYSKVAALLKEFSVNTVYIVPDSEEIQESQKESGLDVSVGLYGGLKNAIELETRLEDVDISVQIVELPRPEKVEKVDLDAYLHSSTKQEFTHLLDNSGEPEDFEEYEEIKERVEKMNQAKQVTNDRQVTGDTSELFEISLLDVLPEGFNPHVRNPNPIDHIGKSENYFAVNIEGPDTVAYDHKRDVAYNALTYILCEIGERPIESPDGSLSDREIWLAWKWCKENDIFMNEDDSIPSAALNHIARELGYEIGDEMLPYDVYAEAINYVEQEYEINSGREAQTDSKRDNNYNTFYTFSIETALEELEDDIEDIDDKLPTGFSYEDPVWKCDELSDNPKNALALIALLKGYITIEEIQDYPENRNWIKNLTDEEMLELCLFISRKFDLDGDKPPYKALRGLAKEINMDFDDQLTLSQQEKLVNTFYTSTYNLDDDTKIINHI